MLDDLDFSDEDTQKAAAIAGLVELMVLYFVFSDPFKMGFADMGLFLRITFVVLALPLMFVVVKIALSRSG